MTGRADLFRLEAAIVEMLRHKELTYEQAVTTQESRYRRDYLQAQWLGELRLNVGYKAVELLVKQHRLVLASRLQHQPQPLGTCTNRFTP